MSSTKAALGLCETSIERGVDYQFEGRKDQGWAGETPYDKGDLVKGRLDVILNDANAGTKKKKAARELSRLFSGKAVQDFWPVVDEFARRYKRYNSPDSTTKLHHEMFVYLCSQHKHFLYPGGIVADPNLLGPCVGFDLWQSKPMPQRKGLNRGDAGYTLGRLQTNEMAALSRTLRLGAFIFLLDKENVVDMDSLMECCDGWFNYYRVLTNASQTPKNSLMYRQAQQEIEFQDERDPYKTLRIAYRVGKEDRPHAVVPQAEWFDKAVRTLTLDDLLPQFDPAERKLFALNVGRALLGPSGSNLIGYDKEVFTHYYRYFVLLVGDSNIGKSRLLNGISQAMKDHGYRSHTPRSLNERFGDDEIANAHLVILDDTNKAELKGIMGSSKMKTMTSGGNITCEKKNKDADTRPAIGSIFMAANDLDHTLAYEMDSGVRDRLLTLKVRSKLESDLVLRETQQSNPDHIWVKAGVQSLHPEQVWRDLGTHFSVDPSVIVYWTLHLCAEEFMGSVGSIDSVVRSLESRIKVRIPPDPLRTTILGLKMALLLSGRKLDRYPSPDTLSDALQALCFLLLDNRVSPLLDAIKADWEDCGRSPEHPWVAWRELDYSSVRQAYEESYRVMSDTSGMVQVNGESSRSPLNLESFVKVVIKHLTTNSGIKVRPSTANVVQIWRDGDDYLNGLCERLRTGGHIPHPLNSGLPSLSNKDGYRRYQIKHTNWYRAGMDPNQIKEARLSST